MNKKLNEIINEYIIKYDLNSLDVTGNPRELILMLIAHIKSCKVADVKLGIIDLTDNDIASLNNMLEQIAVNKIPPQYITNKAYIYNEEYYVEPGVLIPRPDTETLIEESIKVINENKYTTLLDMCTGTGVVGISISRNSNIAKGDLVDISDTAIVIANKNIELNNVQEKCNVIKSNMFESLYKMNNKYDIIVSNPPYLTSQEMKEISDFVKKEPTLALDGGEDGLVLYRNIYDNAKNFLNNGGSILVEIGYKQADDVVNIIKSHKEYTDLQVIKDINLKNRVILCRFQKV